MTQDGFPQSASFTQTHDSVRSLALTEDSPSVGADTNSLHRSMVEGQAPSLKTCPEELRGQAPSNG